MESQPPGKKRKGGIRQRISKSSQQSNGVNSCLAQFLLSMFAWGNFSPQRVQHIAALACRDFANKDDDWLADLEALASLGTNGAHVNNVHRDLMAKMHSIPSLPEPFHVKLKFAEPLGWQDQGIMLPHEMFSVIYHKYPATWRKSVLPSEHKLHEWWTHVEEHPQMLNHPIKTRDQWARWGIPLAIHGDGVPITGIGKGWCKLMTMFTWSSLLGSGNTLEMLFWIWSVFDKLCHTGDCDGTMQSFFAILKWSLFWLWVGKWPDEDWTGRKSIGCNYINCFCFDCCFFCFDY
jgi:hypothetical protein